MSKFSILFSELLKKKNISIYGLSQITDIDRTYLQKIKKGDRLPKEPKFLDELIKGMHLTQTEAIELYDAFEITVLGEDRYLSRKEIVKIINTIYDVNNSKLFIKPTAPLDFNAQNIPTIIKGKNNIQNLIKLLLEKAIAQRNCKIRLISQPTFSFLYDYISTLNLDAANVVIENIINFTLPSESHDFYLDNLSIFEKILPLFYNSSNYHPYYVYNSNPNNTINLQFMPIKIILPNVILFISADYTQAVFSTDTEMYQLVLEYYKRALSNASPIFQIVNSDPNSYLEDILKFMDFNTNANYNIMYQPCILPFIPNDIFLDILNVKVLTQEIMDTIASYMKHFANYAGIMYMTITKEGILDFFEKNYLLEVPDFLVDHKPSMEQRLTIFKNMIDAFKEDKVVINIVDFHDLKISPTLLICAYTEREVVIHHFSSKGDSAYIRLLEMGLASSFYDFLSTVHKSKLVKTKAETLMIMEGIYNKYLSQNNSYPKHPTQNA